MILADTNNEMQHITSRLFFFSYVRNKMAKQRCIKILAKHKRMKEKTFRLRIEISSVICSGLNSLYDDTEYGKFLYEAFKGMITSKSNKNETTSLNPRTAEYYRTFFNFLEKRIHFPMQRCARAGKNEIQTISST